MKFLATFFAAGAVASSVGTPLVKKASLIERDAATVTSAISSISDATKSLGTVVQGFNGAGQAAAVQSASQKVIDSIKSGTTAVSGSGELSQADALTLTQPVQDLGTLVNNTVNDAISKKQAFASAGVGSVVLDQLTQQRDAAKAFADAVTSKVPQALQGVAANLANPINQALDNGVQAFSDQKGSGGSSGSASATGSVSTSASGSASGSASVSSATSGASSASLSSVPSATESASGSGSIGTTALPSSASAASPSVSSFTGAAVPTAFANVGAAAMAAIAAVAAL